jgi:hypothetical protein
VANLKAPSVSLSPTDRINQPTKNGPNAPDSDYDAGVQMLYTALQHALRYSMPDYEYWEPQTIGGKTGKYQLLCPFDTTCEYRVLSLAATDVTTAYIGKYPNYTAPGNATNIGGDPSLGTAVPDMGVQGVVMAGAANTTSPGSDVWLPFAANNTLLIDLIVGSSHAAWVTIIFRRRIQASGVWLEGA